MTNYTYDALDNLLSVSQGGSRARSFVYDSLSRLTSSTNPEVGPVNGTGCPITYTYDADSNLATKVAPAPNQTSCSTTVTTTYSYDPLDRLTGKTYSNGDPAVTYIYDQTACLALPKCANIGHRTSMTDAAGSEAWAFDTVDRLSTDQRTTNSIPKPTNYLYNYDGSIATLTYPSGNTITYTTDSAARPSDAQDLTNAINYVEGSCANGTSVNGVCYAPQGTVASLVMGETSGFAGITFTGSYNDRLQPNEFKAASPSVTLFDLSYCFYALVSGACPVPPQTGNNGNVIQITNNLNSNRTQQFSYDALNRIATGGTTSSCSTSCWGLTFTIDQWGNLTTAAATGTATALNLNVNANNQITTAPFTYDAAGNETADAVSTYVWNAEGQLTTGGGVTYTYDGDGKRVMKSNGKMYWYGMTGDVLDESTLSGSITDEYVFFGARRVARRDGSGNVVYYVADHLGTSRVIASSVGAILDDSDFYPFGGEHVFASSSGNTYKFTGKERDAETGNDNFGARYDSSTIGRFMSPDPLLSSGHPNDPQSWNRYAHAVNNPLAIIDPFGLYNLVNNCALDDKKCNKQFQQYAKNLKQGLADLKKKVDNMKDGPEKQRLEASLQALGTENDNNNVNVKFSALSGGAAGNTDPVYDDKTGGLSFNVTFDPSKISGGTNDWAIDAAHEGTHVSDISDPRFANPATTLDPFQQEYRGYQTSAWAAQALGVSSLAYEGGRNVIWNSGWAAVDRQTLMDKGITQHVTGIPGHPEPQPPIPHNPWPN